MTTPLSSDIAVNTVTTNSQSPTGVVALTSGVTVVGWYDQSTGESVGKMQLLDVDGAKVGGEISVGRVENFEITALAGGGFAAVWTQMDGRQKYAVKAQIFDAGGSARGGVIDLGNHDYGNTPILGVSLYDLEVIALSDGGFATAWTQSTGDSSGIMNASVALRFVSASGAVEARVGQSVGSGKTEYFGNGSPTLAELPGGQVLLSWSYGGRGAMGMAWNQGGAVYDLSGVHQRTFDFPARTDGGFFGSSGVSTATLSGGQVAVVWNNHDGVWMSIYDGAGLARGDASVHTTPLPITTAAAAGEPQIVPLPDGRFLVAYSVGGDVMGRVFTASGAAEGVEFQIGQQAAGTQGSVDIAILPNGTLVAVWSQSDGDGSGAAVKASVFTLADGQQGTANADALNGGAGEQFLVGLEGADTLNGGAGADTLMGGAGADHFVLNADGSADRVLDFVREGSDIFDLRTAAGAQATGGLVIIDQLTGQTWWDPDSDAGSAAPISLGRFNVSTFSRDDFATGFRPDGLRVLTWNGGREDTVFDWSTQKTFATASFDAQGRAEMWHVQYDDGSFGTRWWDTTNTQAFSTRAADYNGKGELLAYGVTYDAGHSQVFQFDVNNTKAWSRLVDIYDALGRQSMQGVVWDDGTAAEIHFDTYDVHAWAYYIDNYKDGSLLNHTFYKADGTVFVG